MTLSDHVAGASHAMARWFDRNEDVVMLVIGQSGAITAANRAFLRRSGRVGRTDALVLGDLLEASATSSLELLLSPRFGAPSHQLLTCRGDGSTWLCATFAHGDSERVLLGSRRGNGADERAREHDVLTGDIAAFQRQLTKANRELVAAKDVVETALARDALTGVASRHALDERAAIELQRAARHGHPLSLVVCDIDHFKRVNDTYGHAAGDDVLRQFAAVMAGCCRPMDLPGRQGGEEFSVLAPDTDRAGAAALAERIRVAVAACALEAIDGAVTASFGVAQWVADETRASWEARADAALYRAKAEGRNRVVCAPDTD